MRDRRFIAAHRGGPLSKEKHRLLAAWAADCAEHVLPFFERSSSDDHPRRAIEVGRAWSRGEVTVGAAQKASVAAHAAARASSDAAAIAAARSAGQAVATAHFAEHSLGAAYYALVSVEAASGSFDAEYEWQLRRLPRQVRNLVISGMDRRFPKLTVRFKAARERLSLQSLP